MYAFDIYSSSNNNPQTAAQVLSGNFLYRRRPGNIPFRLTVKPPKSNPTLYGTNQIAINSRIGLNEAAKLVLLIPPYLLCIMTSQIITTPIKVSANINVELNTLRHWWQSSPENRNKNPYTKVEMKAEDLVNQNPELTEQTTAWTSFFIRVYEGLPTTAERRLCFFNDVNYLATHIGRLMRSLSTEKSTHQESPTLK